MKKLERVQAAAYRRMQQIDTELQRLEERPQLDLRLRYGSLLKRFEEVEKLHYSLRSRQAPNPLSANPTDFDSAGAFIRTCESFNASSVNSKRQWTSAAGLARDFVLTRCGAGRRKNS